MHIDGVTIAPAEAIPIAISLKSSTKIDRVQHGATGSAVRSIDDFSR